MIKKEVEYALHLLVALKKHKYREHIKMRSVGSYQRIQMCNISYAHNFFTWIIHSCDAM